MLHRDASGDDGTFQSDGRKISKVERIPPLTDISSQLLGEHPGDVLQQPSTRDVCAGANSATAQDRQQ